MTNLIQDILFSDLMVMGLLGLVILFITVWSNSLKEYPGYILGWLVGIFFILTLSTLLPPAPPQTAVPLTPPGGRTFTFFELIIPSFIGLIVGFGLLFVLRLGGYSNSRVGRALTVAALMTFTLTAGYLILRSPVADRWGLAVFALTFSIGALLNFILTRSASRNLMSQV